VIDQGKLYTDLTGRSPQLSSRGNWYVMVEYSFDCNYIKPVAMKSKSASEWLKAFGGILQELASCGFNPKLQTMDNEASAALNIYFTENDMTYQLEPHTVTGATLLSVPSELSRNTLWHAWHQWTHIYQCTFGIAFSLKQK
jgi:hypothetical protein